MIYTDTETSSYGTEEYLEKQYLGEFFSETGEKSLAMARNNTSRNVIPRNITSQCILFGSRNAVVNGVSFDISERTKEHLVHSAQPIYYTIAALSTHVCCMLESELDTMRLIALSMIVSSQLVASAVNVGV